MVPGVSGPTALRGLRVVEVGSGIASAYCAKLLADQGADVVKVEPPAGDPLRLWRATDPDRPAPGPLFRYLNTSKRSAVLDGAGLSELAGAADVLVAGTDTSPPAGGDRTVV